MNANRRAALIGTSSLLALAACAGGASNASTVQSVFSAIQYALPLLDVLALGIAVAVPAAAPIVAVVEPYLGSAAALFQTMSATMSDATAKPIVARIEGYLSAAVAAVSSAVAAAPAGSKAAAFQPKIAQAQAVLALLTAFVNGVQAMPTARTSMPALLHK